MMNKYQESFNDIVYHMPYMKQRAYHQQIEILQELIDKYEFLEKEHTRLLKQVDYLAMRVSRDESIRFVSVMGQLLDNLESEKQ